MVLLQTTKTSTSMMKIRQYVLGAVVHHRGVYLFRSLDNFARGSNSTIGCLHQLFSVLVDEDGGRPLPKTVFLQMDNCTRENKNKYLMAYLSDLVMKV